MTPIPLKLRKQLASDPFYKFCARGGLHSHTCNGRITWEHAIIYAGKQVQERWAIIPLCEKAHSVNKHQDGGDLNKNINEWIALNRASGEDLLRMSKGIDYSHRKVFLNRIFGAYHVEKPGISCGNDVEINYDILVGNRVFQ